MADESMPCTAETPGQFAGPPSVIKDMTNPYFPLLFSGIAIVLLWLVGMIVLLAMNYQWWQIRWVRLVGWCTPLAGLLSVGLWAAGMALEMRWLTVFGANASVAMLTVLIAIDVALPLSGIPMLIDRIRRALHRRRERSAAANATAPTTPPKSELPKPELPDVTGELATQTSTETAVAGSEIPAVAIVRPQRVNKGRRSFVVKAAAAIPAATVSTSLYGLVASHGTVQTPEIRLTFDNLHPDLEGLRILHLSDLHLGNYVDLGDLERLMIQVGSLRADLVLVSGDIADDLNQLPGALRLISALKPRFGVFATLGNHEYFQGIERVVRIIDAGPIPLLRHTGTAIRIGAADLYVGGADDPVTMGARERIHSFLRDSVTRSFDGAPSEAFHLLMSHRPEGFDIAVEQKIAMTIAGHTHGVQLGFNGRSMLEAVWPERYLWGHYQRNGSQLYTSAGTGHWFPFRLGCPPEAPLYVLTRGSA